MLSLVLLTALPALIVADLARHAGDDGAPEVGVSVAEWAATPLAADERALDRLDPLTSALVLPQQDGEIGRDREEAITRFIARGGRVVVLADASAARLLGFPLYGGVARSVAAEGVRVQGESFDALVQDPRPILAPADANTFLTTEEGSFADVDRDGKIGDGDARGPFVVAASSRDGRIVVFGFAEAPGMRDLVDRSLVGRTGYLDLAPRGEGALPVAITRVALDLREPRGLGGLAAALALSASAAFVLSRPRPESPRTARNDLRLSAEEVER